jgi:hypothetical protein
MMFLTSSILLGFIRLSFIILFLFYLNRKFVNVSRHVNFLEFIIRNWFRYAAVILIIIFSLVQLNAYNLFNTMFLLLIILGIDIIGIENLKRPREFFNIHIKATLLGFLRNVENKRSFWFWFALDNSRKRKKTGRNTLLLVLTIIIGAVTFLSRYYFIIYDNYSLSDAWIYDLSKVIPFDSQLWFSNELSVQGEFAMVNFYGKVTDVSPEIALQVIAILESTLLAIIIFWTIHKLTPSKYIAPIIASFSFALVYVLTPLNVYFLLKANPIFFALTLALPAFVYYLRPLSLKAGKMSYFLSYVLIFTGIGMIDLFTMCILVPPFLIVGLLITKVKHKKYNLLAILGFLTAALVLFGIYSVACYYEKGDLVEFFNNSLLSVSSYTYVPQLIFPYAEIIRYAQYGTFIGFFLVVVLIGLKKEDWRSAIVFFVYFNFLILLTYVKTQWLDVDMLKNSLSVFLPIILGLNVAIIVRIGNFVFGKYERFSPVTVFVLMAAMIYTSIYYQERKINSLIEADKTPKQILDAYDKIGQTFFPFSYCVVNDATAQVISTNKHFFMNYDFFLDDYPEIDSMYFKFKKDPKFLVENPEYSVSKSVLVFVLNDDGNQEDNVFSLNKHLKKDLLDQIERLRKRGRKVTLFYESDILDVYEIINEPKESKISDLIF